MAEFASMIKENEFLRLNDEGVLMKNASDIKKKISIKNKETVVTLFKDKI